jgi:lipid II:glycine glycyltransferase (peptidoglycan interpeptide bridge formation enzyme)
MQSFKWEVEVDRTTPEAWSQLLDLFDDANIYQTAAYGGVRWGEKNLSRIVLKRNDEVVGMAQLRIVRPTPLKFGMAYLRWGPLWERRGLPLDSEVPMRLGRAIEEEYIRRRKLLVRIVPNAFVGSSRAATMQAALGRFVTEPSGPENTYRTICLDVRPSLEDLRKGLDKKWRNQLTRSEKNNLTVTSGDDSTQFCAFADIYRQMLDRKQFETTVDIEEFAQMQEQLPDSQRFHVLIARKDSIPVAGLVASAMGDSAIYLLGATSDEGLDAKGAYLLQWTFIELMRQKSIKQYDLGGIDPEANPGVYHFKKGFSGVDVCQLSPLVASASAVSSGIVKAGLAVQRTLKQFGARN